MKLIDLSGQWNVTLDDGTNGQVILPGTLDENNMGPKDVGSNQWHPAEELGEGAKNNTLIHQSLEIATRFTRKHSYEGVATYSRQFSLEENQMSERVFFEAERTRKLVLRMNGQKVESYFCGTLSTPYIFELTNHLEKENTIELLCDNSYEGWPREAILYSSAATDETQTNWNGILGYIRLRIEKEVFISNVRVYPKGTKITVQVDIDGATPYEGTVHLLSSALGCDVKREVSLEAGFHTIIFESLPLKEGISHWDEYEGNLYELRVIGDDLDTKTVSFGVRDFGDIGNGHLNLNGRKIFLRSETNCCVFPETGHMPLTVNEWTDILNIYKSYGVNCMRFHSHCPPEAAFTAADKIGMLMHPELSHWNPKTAFEDEESWHYYQLELKQILLTYANHPSFVMLAFGNELHANELGHKRMDKLLQMAKEMDPTRMIANGSNVHYGNKGTDVNSDFYTASNFYDKEMRGTYAGMTGYINKCYPNAKTNFNQVMKEIRKEYARPVFSFEVGQYESLPDFDEINDFKGVTLPNNFSLIKKQVAEKGFLPDWKKRVEATGELARIAYREEIEAALRTRDLSGISLLGLQDFPGQGTALVGMLNSHLKPKPFHFAKPENFNMFFTNVLPLVLLEKYTYTNSEILIAYIELANYGKETIQAPTIYELKDGDHVLSKGEIPAVASPQGEVTVVGRISIPLMAIKTAQKLSLQVTIDAYQNEYPIWVYPDEQIEVFDSIMVATTFLEAKSGLAEGKTVFFSPKADLEHFPSSVESQFTTDFWSVGTFPSQGGCMGCLMDPDHPVFLGFPTEFHSNWQWWPMSKGRAMMIPDEIGPLVSVIDCYARLRKLAFLFECKVGKGKLMVSSMGLLENQQYPEVRALTNSILRYMDSQEFAPKQEISLEVLGKMFDHCHSRKIDVQ